MYNKKIVFFTSNRADFGLQARMIHLANCSDRLECSLIVSGSHLTDKYGMTIEEIIQLTEIDIHKIPINISSDKKEDIGRSMASLTTKISSILNKLDPDILVLLGDRYELIPVGFIAILHGIKIAHIHGGESTLGAIDDKVRDAITSFATIHFTATEKYASRVRKITKEHKHIYNVGGMGVDIIKNTKTKTKQELESSLGISLKNQNVLITFHAETLAIDLGVGILKNLLNALKEFPEIRIIFTAANFDRGGREINELIKEFCSINDNAFMYKSLGIINYISCLKLMDIVIGNSSSGLLEAPTVQIPTINLGRRQEGRARAKSVIDCSGSESEIVSLMNSIFSKKISMNESDYHNPYGMGGSSEKIVNILEGIEIE